MKNQTIYFYLQLEGPELDIMELHSVFSKCSCYGSPVGDTYYTYEDGDKIARTRKKAYFQARMEYVTDQPDPLNDIIVEFVNTYFYEGAELHNIVKKNTFSLWCSVASDAPEVSMTMKPSAMKKLADAGLELRITVMQNGHMIQHA